MVGTAKEVSLPMQAEPNMLSISSTGIVSIGGTRVSCMISGDSAWISIVESELIHVSFKDGGLHLRH